MEESSKEKIYNKLLQIAEKYKATEQSPWNTMTKEDIVKDLLQSYEIFTTTESIDMTLKEADDPLCLNLTTIDPPHPGGA